MKIMLILLVFCAPVLAGEAFSVKVSGEGQQHMILIPGLSCSGEAWASSAAHFSENYRVHTLSLAGFAGKAPLESEGLFLAEVRAQLAAYIRNEGLQRPIVMGHSLGAFMAFWLASSEPNLTGPIIAVDGVPFISALFNPQATEENSRAQAEMMGGMMGRADQAAFATQTRMSMRPMFLNEDDFEAQAARSAKSHPGTVGKAVQEMMTTDLRDDVAAVTQPVLLIGASGGWPDAQKEAMKRAYAAQIKAIPNAKLVLAEGARHFIQADDPGFLHTTVANFLEKQARRSAGGGR